VLYAAVFHLIPFEEDNVYVLAWSAATPAARVLAVDPSYYPEWRPLAYATVWGAQHLGAPVVLQFGVNLALWIACALLVMRITFRLTQSSAGAFLAGALVLTDPRATWALVAIVERQTSMACLFGLGAVLVAMEMEERRTTARQCALMVLLAAAILSKEYGAAFTAAIAVYGVSTRRRELWLPASAAAVIYVALRMTIVGAIVQPYCEEMYFFGAARDVCIDASNPSSFAQMAYNAAATIVNLPLLGLLSGSGQPIFAESRLVTGVLCTGLAIFAVAKRRGMPRMLLLIPLANGLLSVMIYRDRNQLAGACALAILAGIGLDLALQFRLPRLVRTAMLAAIIALVAAQAGLARALVAERQAIASQVEPCRLEIMDRPFVPPYVASLKTIYGLPDPQCDSRH
jgi:hypothetical protein